MQPRLPRRHEVSAYLFAINTLLNVEEQDLGAQQQLRRRRRHEIEIDERKKREEENTEDARCRLSRQAVSQLTY